jgi:hypothetical protein
VRVDILLLTQFYVRVDILLICWKHLHHLIISFRRMEWHIKLV